MLKSQAKRKPQAVPSSLCTDLGNFTIIRRRWSGAQAFFFFLILTKTQTWFFQYLLILRSFCYWKEKTRNSLAWHKMPLTTWPPNSSSPFIFPCTLGQGALGGLLTRALILIMRAPSSWPNDLPKAHLLLPSPQGLRFQHTNFAGTQTFRPQQPTTQVVTWTILKHSMLLHTPTLCLPCFFCQGHPLIFPLQCQWWVFSGHHWRPSSTISSLLHFSLTCFRTKITSSFLPIAYLIFESR